MLFDFFRKQATEKTFWIFLDVDGVLNCKEDWRFQFRLNKKTSIPSKLRSNRSAPSACRPSSCLLPGAGDGMTATSRNTSKSSAERFRFQEERPFPLLDIEGGKSNATLPKTGIPTGMLLPTMTHRLWKTFRSSSFPRRQGSRIATESGSCVSRKAASERFVPVSSIGASKKIRYSAKWLFTKSLFCAILYPERRRKLVINI